MDAKNGQVTSFVHNLKSFEAITLPSFCMTYAGNVRKKNGANCEQTQKWSCLAELKANSIFMAELQNSQNFSPNTNKTFSLFFYLFIYFFFIIYCSNFFRKILPKNLYQIDSSLLVCTIKVYPLRISDTYDANNKARNTHFSTLHTYKKGLWKNDFSDFT